MPMPIQKVIQQYTDSIISGRVPGPLGSCPICFTHPRTFRLHECRKRSFRYIVGNMVRDIITLLPRWKCSECGKTFTVYPSFAVPHKQYVWTDIRRLTRRYIEDESKTYCATVTHLDAPIGYQEEDDKNVDRFLDPSTVWRWISWLGNVKLSRLVGSTLNKADNVQDDPKGDEVLSIPSPKYRSPQRRAILHRVRCTSSKTR
jgi:hypothetical protein